MADVEEYRAEDFTVAADKLLHAIKFRRSTRFFEDKKIEQEKLENIVQAGRYSATGSNSQGCSFYIVQEDVPTLRSMVWAGIENAPEGDTDMAKMMIAAIKSFIELKNEKGVDFLFRNAPCVVYIASNSALDAGLAAQNMEMVAAAQGLGVLYNGFLQRSTSLSSDALKWLGMSDKPICACMLMGYPEKTYERTAPRKKADVTWR